MMATQYLKQSTIPDHGSDEKTVAIVQSMLARIATEGETAVRDYAETLDGWIGPIVVTEAQIEAAAGQLPEDLKADIRYAHENIRAFALAQRASAHDMEIELRPGLFAGQRHIPLTTAGCYVPGGR